MPRFFTPHSDFRQSVVTLVDTNEIHHMKNVLRLKKGDEVSLFNGQGEEASGILSALTGTQAEIQIRSVKKADRKNTSLILACAIPKKAKFEFIIEKCTELGVDEIIPLLTHRTEIRIKGEKAEAKTRRYQTVAVNAAKQCQRSTVPRLHPVTRFADLLKAFTPDDTILIPHLGPKRKNIMEVLQPSTKQRIVILIGPEGDFTPDEVKAAEQAGAVAVSLGETVLKVDTAAIAVVTLVRFLSS